MTQTATFRETFTNYLRIDAHGMPQCSSDSYFFIKRIDGVTQVFRSALTGGWLHQLTFFEEGVDGYCLSPDGRSMAVVVNKAGSEQNPIAVVDTKSLTVRYAINVPDVQSGNIIWKSDSSGFIFRSNVENKVDFKIYEYTFLNDEYELLIDTKGYTVPLDFSHDGNKVLYMVRPSSANQDLYLFDRETGTSTHLTNHDGNQRYRAKFADNGNDNLYLLTDDGDDFNKLYHYTISSKERRHLGKEIGWEITDVQLSPCKRYLLYTSNREGYTDFHLIDTVTNTNLPVPRSRGVINSFGFAPDGRFIYAYHTPSEPMNIYMWDCLNEKKEQLTYSRFFGVDATEFVEPELITIDSFDGLKVPAFLYLPKNHKRTEPIPMVVCFHGGPEGQSRPMFVSVYQQFMKLGIGICLPNVRGSSGYGMHYQALDDYKKRMDSVKDGIEVAKHLIEKGYTTKEQLGVLGGSYGGFMCLSVITEAPELWSAAVDMVGISNIETFLENTKPSRRKIREVEYGPLSDREFLRSVSPIYKMDKVRTPLLVAHGRTDPRVPIGEAEQVVEKLRERKQVVEPLFFDDEGHGIRKLHNRITYYEKVFDFFTRYLVKS
jgi:dipeptidyl aminopeptidase/acylaminoacyl peptidase